MLCTSTTLVIWLVLTRLHVDRRESSYYRNRHFNPKLREMKQVKMVNEERINFHFTLMKDQKLRVHTARLRSTLHGYLRSLITALLSLNYFCLTPVKWAFRIFFRCLALGSSIGTIKAVLQSDGVFFTYVYVRMLNTRQWTSLRVCRSNKNSTGNQPLHQ